MLPLPSAHDSWATCDHIHSFGDCRNENEENMGKMFYEKIQWHIKPIRPIFSTPKQNDPRLIVTWDQSACENLSGADYPRVRENRIILVILLICMWYRGQFDQITTRNALTEQGHTSQDAHETSAPGVMRTVWATGINKYWFRRYVWSSVCEICTQSFEINDFVYNCNKAENGQFHSF